MTTPNPTKRELREAMERAWDALRTATTDAEYHKRLDAYWAATNAYHSAPDDGSEQEEQR